MIGFEKRLLQNLSNIQYIFMSFGEIDCREDEGIILHCKKVGKDIQNAAKTTASTYFRYTYKALSKYKKKIVYFGTPAPFKAKSNSVNSAEENEQRLITITTFNQTLAKCCEESGLLFADVYNLTANKAGYNNGEWMIDPIHLKPDALNALVQNL